MTVNVSSPFGFLQVGTASGPPNFAFNANPPYKIAYGYSTKIFFGDAVRMNASVTGYIEQWAAGDGDATHILAGIFYGCSYYSSSQKQNVFSNYWPGADTAQDAVAYVCDDPNAQFKVQAGAAGITAANLGQTVDIASTPTGSVVTGQSAMLLGTPTTTATLPFKVVNLITSPPNAPGTDIAGAYNNVIVAFNYQTYKSLVGI